MWFAIWILITTGDFDIVNFRDVTTESDLNKKTIIFAFEFNHLARVNSDLDYSVHLIWIQVIGPQSGAFDLNSAALTIMMQQRDKWRELDVQETTASLYLFVSLGRAAFYLMWPSTLPVMGGKE